MISQAIERINESLQGLTDFQRATVDAASKRLVGKDGYGRRLLVGDEVGLGKTLVARGVVATLLRDRLECGPLKRPLRVVYICSNLALAQENVKKLAVFHGEEAEQWVSTPKFGRLAELGLQQPPPGDDVLMELCSLTPATSFSLTQGTGNARERYIIWRAVLEMPGIKPAENLENFFRNGVTNSWDAAEHYFYSLGALEPLAAAEFHARLAHTPTLDPKPLSAARDLGVSLDSWCALINDLSELDTAHSRTKSQSHLFAQVRARVREMFAESCARNLRADIFILDEFQRFRDLINIPSGMDATEDDTLSEQQLIARRVLHDGESYVTLLLSATPFKALTHVVEEDEGKAHAQELAELVTYLCRSDQATVDQYVRQRDALLDDILSLPAGPIPANSLNSEAKRRVESILRKYICRTERISVEPDIERLFSNLELALHAPGPSEVEEFIALDRLSAALKKVTGGSTGIDIMALYKAAPWCLSFLGGYQLRESLRNHRDIPDVQAALKQATAAWIPYEKFQRYQIDLSREASSSRFKQVLEAAMPAGAERLLWVPPSMPYYEGEGPFANQEGFSKTLLFSSLVLAPRALSSYVSYECERRLLPAKGKRPRYFEDREEHSRTFRFDGKTISPAWSLVYPSARLGAVQLSSSAGSLKALRADVKAALSADYKRLCSMYGRGTSGQRQGAKWYTLAPLLLDWLSPDGKRHVKQWKHAMARLSESAETRKMQVERLLDLLEQDKLELGTPPEDLFPYLVDLAIAGPGVCMLRSLNTVWKLPAREEEFIDIDLLAHATDAALAFIDKMNRMESQRVLRAVLKPDKPWLVVSRYSVMGNLQAVFDEYLHLLKSIHGTLADSVMAFKAAAGTGSVSITAQTRLPPPKQVKRYDVRFHCHYAVPLGNQKSTDEQGISRITNARAAFNSPFWPFMLNSTSIGQEGLDFHWYCRRIVHWNLPSNPIDLEQREGRINRFKSLVVRQRVAQAYGKMLVASSSPVDVWSELFQIAKADARRTELVPYWHSPAGTAQIERVVPAMPFSLELSRLDEILRILSLYRLSFGQPRQQELVENLLKQDYSDTDLAEITRALLIDLAPINFIQPKSHPAGQRVFEITATQDSPTIEMVE